MLRFVQVGLGPLGVRIASDAQAGSVARVVAAVDTSPSLAGCALATLVVGADPAVVVQPTLEAVASWEGIDAAVVATRSDLARCAPLFRDLLQRGLTVVSTCEELLHPWLRHPGLADELSAVAARHGGRLLGTGVNPGFLMDALPLFATAACTSVRSVEVYRIQDAATRRVPFQRKIGVTLDEDAFAARVAEGTIRHVGLGESLHFLARHLGFTIDRWHEELAPVLAARSLDSALGLVEAGRVAGVRQVARGWEAERCVVELVFQAAIGQPDPRDGVRIDGEPPFELIIPGGVHGDVATSALVLNALEPLHAAPPGLHTMATIPMVHGRRG